MSRIIIVSNRLPVSVKEEAGTFSFQPSVGGLATGVGALMKEDNEILWAGWPGVATDTLSDRQRQDITRQLKKQHYYPVFLTQDQLDGYYSGFSNDTIWPLFHYFAQHAVYRREDWDAYVDANRTFATAVRAIAKPDDIVWIHDYQLMLLPEMLREMMPGLTIGFFLHIPFPSFEVFRLLPWRREIMEGLLGADLIGFHTYDYTRHFLSSLRNRLGLEHALGRISVGNRTVKVDTFPMGIEYEKFASAGDRDDVKDEIVKVQKDIGDRSNRQLVLSVDRLDYTKGIPERLQAFDRFLDTYPQYHGTVTLILVAVPSRTDVEKYQLLKREVDELVGRINGKHGAIGWMPVWYLFQFLSFAELTALYLLADVALITPVRDGMNLIAKEYIATKTDGTGVLILSEMAGAAREMSESLIVNPNNQERVAEALDAALTMPKKEQIERNRMMQKRLMRYTVEAWAHDFITMLNDIKEHERVMQNRKITGKIQKQIVRDYQKSKKRIFLLDYDGTLRTFEKSPEDAAPDAELLALMKKLAADARNEVVIISGRDKTTLGKWFKGIPLSMVAEHGVWIHEKGGIWELIEPLANYWKDQIRPILERYMDRTPGSLIEEKDYSLVWHYRKSDPALAEVRARELKESLLHFTTNLGLGVLEGNKVIEIKNAGINKGHAAQKWVALQYYDFILAAGDDRTDEDTFQVLPEHSYSIKIGLMPTVAHYYLETVADMRALLEQCMGKV